MAAVTLSRYNVNFQLIDKMPFRAKVGHAITIQPRTQEIFQTMGLLHPLEVRGCHQSEIALWTMNDGILQQDAVEPVIPPVAPYRHLLNTHQGNIEGILLDELSSKGVALQDQMEFITYEYNTGENQLEWPVKALIRNLCSGQVETWYVKYIVGADGPQSLTRSTAGIELVPYGEGETWAVADVMVETNFPGIRRLCAIRSPHGNCVLLPLRDEGARIMMPLDEQTLKQLQEASPGGSDSLTQFIERRIVNILRPYQFSIANVQWINQCQCTPSLAKRFQDGEGHVFLVGDACHSHLIISSQDLNLGICDAYNLTWKLALILKGIVQPTILSTYEEERRHVAERSVAFDVEFMQIFQVSQQCTERNWVDIWRARQAVVSGIRTEYPLNMLNVYIPRLYIHPVQEALRNGRRMFPSRLIRHIDGNNLNLLDVMLSNGRFHIFVFAGKLSDTAAFIRMARTLESDLSPVRNLTINDAPLEWSINDATPFRLDVVQPGVVPHCSRTYHIDVFLIHTHSHLETEITQFPAPFSTVWKSQIFEDRGGLFHSDLGIDESKGALVLVRPDGYVTVATRIDFLQDITVVLGLFLVA